MKNQKSYLIILLVFAVLFSSSSCNLLGQKTEMTNEPTTVLTPAATTQTPINEHKFSFNGVERSYLLRIPLGLNDTQPAPVVFVLHGRGGKPQDMYRAGFNSIADQKKFIVIYPYYDEFDQPDFIKHILEDVRTNVNVDPKRIYSTGFSLGSIFSYRIACEMSDTFAAIAPVAAYADDCSDSLPDHPVSVIHIHGLADPTYPFSAEVTGLPAPLTFWVGFNGCDNSPNVDHENRITHISYAPCQDGTTVEIYTIDGMYHNWPPSEMSASRIIWEFFEDHPKP